MSVTACVTASIFSGCQNKRKRCSPPPTSRNHLAQEPTPGSAVEFSHHFFYQGSGFFMFLVDVGQLFRCAGHHFMCVTTGPPIRGDPISHSQAHIPLKPLPPALDPFPEATSGTGFWPSARTNPWFCGQILGEKCAQEPTPGSTVKHCWFLDTGGGGGPLSLQGGGGGSVVLHIEHRACRACAVVADQAVCMCVPIASSRCAQLMYLR